MPGRKPRYVLVAFLDDETNRFNVVGPVTDYEEDEITNRTVALHNKGKRVRCSCSFPVKDISSVPSKTAYIKEWEAMGYTLDPALKW